MLMWFCFQNKNEVIAHLNNAFDIQLIESFMSVKADRYDIVVIKGVTVQYLLYR